MKYKNTARFVDSMDNEYIDSSDVTTFERQMNTYSLESLKAAIPIDKLFIETENSKTILETLSRVFQLAREFDMPTGAILMGPTGVGKTTSFQFFHKTLPNSSLFTTSNAAIHIRSKKGMRAGHLISMLLKHFGYPFNNGSDKQMDARKNILFDLLNQKGTRLIFIDEANNLLRRKGRTSELVQGESEVTDLLREIMDVCRIGVVLAGPESLDGMKDCDPALFDRLSTRLTFSHLKADRNWVAVVTAFTRSVQIDLTFLSSDLQLSLLHRATGGSFRKLKHLIREIVLIMVHRKIEVCDSNVMRDASQVLFGIGSDEANVYA